MQTAKSPRPERDRRKDNRFNEQQIRERVSQTTPPVSAVLLETDSERRGEAEPTLDQLLARLSPCDLVLIEGFKQEPVPKLEVYRPENGKPPLFPERSDIVAIATDVDLATDLPQLPLNDYVAIADFVMHTMQLQERPC